MTLIDVIAALTSALLHASWNAAIKSSPRPTEAMAAQMLFSAIIGVPALIWTGLPPLESLPWIAVSAVLAVITVTSLLRGYEYAGFGLVYPMARAISVMLVVPLSTWLAGDSLKFQSLIGIALIVTALGIVALGSRNTRDFSPQALLWIVIAGVVTAIYVMCDARGVRVSGSPLAYGLVVSIINAAGMAWRQRHLGSPWRLMRDNVGIALPASFGGVSSYLLILWVWGHAPVAPASALRDTSAIFALLIAVLWLGEKMTTSRVVAVLLAAAAVPLLRLA